MAPVRRPVPGLRRLPALIGLSAAEPVRFAALHLVISNLAAALGGLPDRRIVLALTAACAGFGMAFASGPGLLYGAFWGALGIFSIRVVLWPYGMVAEIEASRHTQARLAVAEERLRFSQDVHDVLGRRLSTIAVKSELAAILADRGDDRAAAQMLEVRQVAHDALAEARELARGYRPTNLTQELGGARSLLLSAGIQVDLEVGVVPPAWHEAAGWVVRESVTNVLRHSSASRVRISYQGGELRIENDGLCAPPRLENGSGLSSLQERLEPMGGRVDAGRQGEQWVVVAQLPENGPIGTVSESFETDPAPLTRPFRPSWKAPV